MLSGVSKVTRNLKVTCLLLGIFTLCPSIEAGIFESCNHIINVEPGYFYLQSPDYPQSYPRGSACRYILVAPVDYDISARCTLNMPKGNNNFDCGSEYFYIDTDGDVNLAESQYFCGTRVINRTSKFRLLVLAHISRGSYGTYSCQFLIRKQTCDCGWSVSTKISNGQEASRNEFPSMVALRRRNKNEPPYCAAVIISHRHMLTAAHCIDFNPNPDDIEALAGRHNVQSTFDTKFSAVYYIIDTKKHPYYSKISLENDVAILITARNIEYSRGVGPICLPPMSNKNNNFAYSKVDVIGWCATRFSAQSAPTLQKINVMILTNDACRTKTPEIIHSNQICTYDEEETKKDSCQSDSGGPVIFRNHRQFLIGIISFGQGCGAKNSSIGINTRITSHLEWIFAQIGRGTTCEVNL